MLYERHSAAARALARQYVTAADAEDVVADAFSKLFEMLRRGVGPDAGFRPYLYTMVRHRSFDVSRGAARTRPSTDDEIESVLGRVASKDDPALQGFERSVIAKAYVDLPERWREVLWYVLVDELKPAQVAPVLGLSPNGVSALLYRAKEALRAGYLQQHLTHAPSDTCRTVNPLLGGYVRASLSKRETTKIDEHLSTCATCSALVLELHDVAHGMKTVIAPLVLGAGGLALVGAGAPIGGMVVAAKAGAGAAAGGAHSASAVSAASSGSFSGAVSSAVSTTAGAVASAAAAATGGSMAAGALAVAAVGLVAALQITAPPEADPLIDTVIATNDARELPGGGPAERVKGGEPVLPTDVVPNEDTAYIEVDYADAAQPLAPRQSQNLSFTVENTGAADATGAQLEVTLPSGLTSVKPEGSFGTGIGGRLVSSTRPAASATPTAEATPTPGATGSTSSEAKADASAGSSTGEIAVPTTPSASPSAPATEGTVPVETPVGCAPTERTNVLLCSIGELAQGATRSVVVPVQANAGGDYPVSAKVWADGLEPMSADLPSRTVAPFGQELSAQSRDVSLSSPGTAPLPVTLVSTGDRTVAPGWAVAVSLPDGVKPASAQSQLSCAAGDLPNSWLCTPLAGIFGSTLQLEPGAAVDMSLNVTTAASSTAQPAELGVANVRPVLDGSARSASATLVATSAWTNAGAGVGTVTASCLAEGGADKADAAVIGSYTNTTQRVVRVALEAAGSREATGQDVAPGESARVTVHDGMRVPAGLATFVLTTDVDGSTYETRVAAGDHRAVDCYRPTWDTATSVQTVNAGGTVGVKGTITNKTGESMFAVMSVPVGGDTLKSVKVPVAADGTWDLSVDTGRTHVPAGDVTFHLSREVADSDGDLADAVSAPANNPTQSFAAAQIQPAAGERTMSSESCVFDAAQDRSVQTFTVTADNTASTLPVPFHVGDVTRTVPAGQTEVIEFPVVWGTDTVPLTAAGQTLDQLDVRFKSCAEVTWPTVEQLTVATAAECVDQNVQVQATVENGTGREWRGVLVQDATGATSEEQAVPAGSTTFVLPQQPLFTLDGNVTVRLTRELEGNSFTVEKSFAVKGENCVLPDPTCEPTGDQSAEQAAFVPRVAAPTDSPWRRLMGLDGCEPADTPEPEQPQA
ncbi:sigma-70 family RNA polymerase sigma factor [Promicromonospora sp. MEB111]|uniref:sigma-70 family RNA polymerase sigma factor n=1 Tax=Promicromonospora sp. MEB111 TaxID=3040301 RepID=UPI00254DC1A4|nr:sigma-70 family RNA polymerase sigma factor [Promicromonospora sp. MEB111]